MASRDIAYFFNLAKTNGWTLAIAKTLFSLAHLQPNQADEVLESVNHSIKERSNNNDNDISITDKLVQFDLYKEYFRYCAKAGEAERLLKVLAQATTFGFNLKMNEWLSWLIEAHSAKGNMKAAFLELEKLKHNGFVASYRAYLSVINNLKDSKSDMEKCLQLIREVRKLQRPIPNSIYSGVLRTCGNNGDLNRCSEIIKMMQEGKTKLSTSDYNILIGAFGKKREFRVCENLYAEMIRGGCKPDVSTYTSLISLFSKEGEYEKCLRWMEEMKMDGLRMDQMAYNAVILLLQKVKKTHLITNFVDDMKKGLFIPDSQNLVVASALLPSSGAFNTIVQTLEAMKKKGVQLDVYSYTALINAFGKTAQDSDECLAIFTIMKQEGIAPNAFTFNSLLGKFTRLGKVEECMELMGEMKQEGITPNLITYNTIINLFGGKRDYKMCLKLLDELKERGLEPDETTLGTLVCTFSRAGDLERCEGWMKTMKEKGWKLKAKYELLHAFSFEQEKHEKWSKLLEEFSLKAKEIKELQ